MRAKQKKGNLGKTLIYGAAIGGAGFLTWRYLIKPLLPGTGQVDLNIQPPDAGGSSSAQIDQVVDVVSSTPPSKSLDYYKVLKLNSPASDELKYVKIHMNDIVQKARMYKGSSKYDADFKKRLERIAALDILDTSTKFGEPTLKNVRVIEGRDDTTLKAMRDRKKNFYFALGLGDPFK